MDTLYILDAASFLFRAYYAIKQMTNSVGQSTNALYGFIRSVEKVIKDFEPTHLIAVFDGPDNKQERQKIYQDYKGHRSRMPDDLFFQLELAIDYCAYAGIPSLMEPGVEADDLIGAIAKWAENEQAHVWICSNDKDLCQLISDQVKMIDIHKGHLVIDQEKVKKIHNVEPRQIVDYLALMGDKADNIPGVPGVGPKTAATLLQTYSSLDNLLSHLGELKNRRLAEKLEKHREDAKLSQQLAQLILDISFPKDPSFFSLKPPRKDELSALYKEMNFASFLKNLEKSPKTPNQKSAFGADTDQSPDYILINELSELQALLKKLEQEKQVCLDTETTGLNPIEAKLVGIGLGVKANQAWYVPANGNIDKNRMIAALKPFLENPNIAFYGHNIKYDLHILLNYGIKLRSVSFDTILASHLIRPHKNRHSLDAVVFDIFGVVKTPIKELIGSGKQARSMLDVSLEKVCSYCCEDVDYTCRLKQIFEKKLSEENLATNFHSLEIPLIFVLLAMERFGMHLDTNALREMEQILSQKIEASQKVIYALAGETFNIKSPKQLSDLLFNKLKIKTGKKKPTTRADFLESVQEKYPIAKEVLRFRFLEKLRSTYVSALPLQVSKKTGRIHCTFNQFVTATGRLSCQNPNLQNIPFHSDEGKKIRQAFRPSNPTWRYLSADYSQIELRLLAHLSGDERLRAGFIEGEDIHTATAAAIFDRPKDLVTKKERSKAKAVNFGIIYGQKAFGLAKQLGISVKEASHFITTYFARYPKVALFLEECKKKVQTTGFATTILGRKRPIPEIHSPNAMIREAAERLAVNTPLQGSQADMMKQAMINIQSALEQAKSPARMALQIHDELIFELPEEESVRVKNLIVPLMENALPLEIPVVVNLALGKNWAEC